MSLNKEVFVYLRNDGQGPQSVGADPIRIYRRLQVACQGQLAARISEAAELNPPSEENGHRQPAQPGTSAYVAALQAQEILAAATIYAFELPPFDPTTGQGTLEDTAMELLALFGRWREQKKTPGRT